MHLLKEPASSMSSEDNTQSSKVPTSSGRLPPRRAPKLDAGGTQNGQDKPAAFSGKLPPRRAPKAVGAEGRSSRLMVTGYPQQVTGEDLLVLPLIPKYMFELLTTLFNDRQVSHRARV